MKRFDKHVRWHFKFNMDGYGQTVVDALRSACEKTLDDIDSGMIDKWAFEKIEAHEVLLIDENDVEGN